jgi:hypothetical protein
MPVPLMLMYAYPSAYAYLFALMFAYVCLLKDFSVGTMKHGRKGFIYLFIYF